MKPRSFWVEKLWKARAELFAFQALNFSPSDFEPYDRDVARYMTRKLLPKGFRKWRDRGVGSWARNQRKHHRLFRWKWEAKVTQTALHRRKLEVVNRRVTYIQERLAALDARNRFDRVLAK